MFPGPAALPSSENLLRNANLGTHPIHMELESQVGAH